jgi:hypothetical protein
MNALTSRTNGYGHDTSDIAESKIALYLEDREGSVIKMLDSIWDKEMGRCFARLLTALPHSVWSSDYGQPRV